MIIRDKIFIWGEKTYVMGIMNITPDSFSGDGLMVESVMMPRVEKQAEIMISAGADILDIGGESTRPGSTPISEQEEIDRVVPVIEWISKRFDVVVSVDTYRAGTAEAAIRAGADIINDIWGLRADKKMAAVAASTGAPVMLMHNRSKPENTIVREHLGKMYRGADYQNLIEEIITELLESVDIAHQAGIADEKIILDPGIGFGKSVGQNLEIINKAGEFRKLGYPVLLGPSRKSFIGYTLDLPPEERMEGTLASVVVGIVRGADLVRTHDIPETMKVVRMTDAIIRGKYLD